MSQLTGDTSTLMEFIRTFLNLPLDVQEKVAVPALQAAVGTVLIGSSLVRGSWYLLKRELERREELKRKEREQATEEENKQNNKKEEKNVEQVLNDKTTIDSEIKQSQELDSQNPVNNNSTNNEYNNKYNDKSSSGVKNNESFSDALQGTDIGLEIHHNNQLIFALDKDGLVNKMNYNQKMHLNDLMTYKDGQQLPLESRTGSFQIFVTQNNQDTKESILLFSAIPGKAVVNRLNDFQISSQITKQLSELNNQQVLSRNAQAQVQRDELIQSMRSGFYSGLRRRTEQEHNTFRWILGNILNPLNWAKGLSNLSKSLSKSTYNVVRGEKHLERQYTVLNNLKAIFNAFGSNLFYSQLATPPFAFQREGRNAHWQQQSLSLANGYSLNLVSSLDLPNCYQVTLTDAGGRQVLSSILKENGTIGYSRVNTKNNFEKNLVRSLFDPEIGKSLTNYNNSLSTEDRFTDRWFTDNNLMKRGLSNLIHMIHDNPYVANFLPPQENQMMINVYQTHLANTTKALSLLSKNNEVIIPHPNNENSQLVFKIQDTVNFSKNVNGTYEKTKELKIYERNNNFLHDSLLFCGEAQPFIGSEATTRFSDFSINNQHLLISLITSGDKLYENFINGLQTASTYDPASLNRIWDELQKYNTYIELGQGRVDTLFRDIDPPAQIPVDTLFRDIDPPAQTPVDTLFRDIDPPAQTPVDTLFRDIDPPAQTPVDTLFRDIAPSVASNELNVTSKPDSTELQAIQEFSQEHPLSLADATPLIDNSESVVNFEPSDDDELWQSIAEIPISEILIPSVGTVGNQLDGNEIDDAVVITPQVDIDLELNTSS